MALREISGSAISSGVTTAISIKTGADPSETGIASRIVNSLLPLVNAKAHDEIVLVSIILGIFSVLLIILFVIQVISHGKTGIITAALGFLGPMIMLLSPFTSIPLILVGVFMIFGCVYIAKNYQ
jgi:hypothetical protein